MSTTIRRGFLALPIVLVAWVGIMALVMRVSDAAPAAVVPMPSARLMATLPDEAAIVDHGRMSVTFANRPGLAADLYAAGARLVLPAGLRGCLPLSEVGRAGLIARGG